MNQKTTRFFSKPLMKQNIKSNYILTIVVTAVMCMMCIVSTYAMSIMKEQENYADVEEAQEDFYSYLYVMASYNEQAGTMLSYEDFENTEDKTLYETAFDMVNQQSSDMNLSVEGLEEAVQKLGESDVSIETYVHEFEYV